MNAAADGNAGGPSGVERSAWVGVALVIGLIAGGSIVELWPWPARGLATPAAAQLRLDPNHATRAELMLLPGIGPQMSRRIMDYRDACTDRPAFRAIEDLDGVRGIGPASIERLREYVWIDAGGRARGPQQ